MFRSPSPAAWSGWLAALLVASPAIVSAQDTHDRVALAVLPLTEADRPTATVLGYSGDHVVTLRRGTGRFVCLTDRPGDDRFQVACYERSLEAYMARGRALRAEGIAGQASIQRRWEEIEAGTLDMPRQPAYLYQLFGQDENAVTPERTDELSGLTVIYVAFAGTETGLPTAPAGGGPWLMFPDKPTAHIMIAH